MNDWQKFLVTGLAACMLVLPLGDLAVSLEAGTPPNPTLVKQQVDRWGVGAEVKAKLAGGKILRGSIGDIEEEGFLLNTGRQASPKRVGYTEVAELKLAKNLYRAAGPPDALAVMRVVEALGVGRHAVAKTTAAQEYHGTIQTIERDSFTLLPDHQTTAVQIQFNEVRELGPNLSKGAKVAIVVGVVLATLVVVVLVIGSRGIAPTFHL
jgi:ribosome maturation factor RimP